MVLIGAAAAGERAAGLRGGGAEDPRRRAAARILASFALRAALIGAPPALVAIVAGGIAGWGVTTFVMEGDFRFAALTALAIVAGGALASLLAGLAFALRPLAPRARRGCCARGSSACAAHIGSTGSAG